MAKKIIKEPTIRHYKANCPICGCEFEFDTTDANWHQEEVRDNSHWGGVTALPRTENVCRVQCPTCNTWLENKQTEIYKKE